MRPNLKNGPSFRQIGSIAKCQTPDFRGVDDDAALKWALS